MFLAPKSFITAEPWKKRSTELCCRDMSKALLKASHKCCVRRLRIHHKTKSLPHLLCDISCCEVPLSIVGMAVSLSSLITFLSSGYTTTCVTRTIYSEVLKNSLRIKYRHPRGSEMGVSKDFTEKVIATYSACFILCSGMELVLETQLSH